MTSIDNTKSTGWLLPILQTFSAKLVLEVFGGGGAIWGFSEAATLRVPDTQEFWRFNASVVGALFFIRFILQIQDYCKEHIFDQSVEETYSLKRMFQIFLAKLVLEVFGGGGAIWGFSEVLTLRNPKTQEFWRGVALSIGGIFFVRFIMQCSDYLDDMRASLSKSDEEQCLIGEVANKIRKEMKTWRRYYEVFSAKLVLEVFGAGGAIWGFSEVVTFRVPETQEFWRKVALVVAVIFTFRYLLQSRDFFLEMKGISACNDGKESETETDLTLNETSPLFDASNMSSSL